MNFIKWLMNILFGWIMYVLKKIIRIKKPLQEINKMAEENRLFNKDFNDKYILTALILVLPLLMSDTYIGQCVICQAFISFMSSFIPGISIMSKESIIPDTVALEISIAWMMVFVIVVINLYRAWGSKTLFIPQENFTKKRVLLYLIGKIAFLFLEVSKSPISFYNGTVGKIKSELRRNEVHDLLQSKSGLFMIAGIEVLWLCIVFAGFILISFSVFKYRGFSIQENEYSKIK